MFLCRQHWSHPVFRQSPVTSEAHGVKRVCRTPGPQVAETAAGGPTSGPEEQRASRPSPQVITPHGTCPLVSLSWNSWTSIKSWNSEIAGFFADHRDRHVIRFDSSRWGHSPPSGHFFKTHNLLLYLFNKLTPDSENLSEFIKLFWRWQVQFFSLLYSILKYIFRLYPKLFKSGRQQ
jgi:hypothetical protein